MINLSDGHRGGTFCHSKAGLKDGDGAATGLGTAAPNGAGIDFSIGGIMYHKAESATNVALTAAAIQAAASKCLYLICLDSAGTYSSVKGVAQLTTDIAAGTKVLQWPTPTAGTCAIGAVKITTVGSTFTAGTTAVTGISTWYDFNAIPDAPLTS